eukprot:jgi/Ulvmu1/9559/UM053_0048.1
MQYRPSMPAIDHSLPEQVAQEWSEASIGAITPGLQEIPADKSHQSPQASAQLTFCALRLAEATKAQGSAAAETSSGPAPSKSHAKSQVAQQHRPVPHKPHHLQQPKPSGGHASDPKPSRLRGPSPLGGTPIQPQRIPPDTNDCSTQPDHLQSHAISLSQSMSNASTAQAHSAADSNFALSELTATISGGCIPACALPDSSLTHSGTPSSARSARGAHGPTPFVASPTRSRSATTKAAHSSRQYPHTNTTPHASSTSTPASKSAAASRGGHKSTAGGTARAAEKVRAPPAAAQVPVPAIDLSKRPADPDSDARADTPSPSGLSVAQKIKWHEAVVGAPDADAATSAEAPTGPERLKRSQSARPAVQPPKYVRCAATAAPQCRPDRPTSAVTSYPIAQPLSRTRSQPAPRRHMFRPEAQRKLPHTGAAAAATTPTPSSSGSHKTAKPYSVVTPRERPPPPLHTAPVSGGSLTKVPGSGRSASARKERPQSGGRGITTAPLSSHGELDDGQVSQDPLAQNVMPVIDEGEDTVVAPVAIAPLPKLGQGGGHLVASRAAQFERVAVAGHSPAPDTGAKAQLGRVAKLTSSAGRSVGNVFRKLTRSSVTTDGWASWRKGGGLRGGGTPTAADVMHATAADAACAAATGALSPLGSTGAMMAGSGDGSARHVRMPRSNSVASTGSQQSGPEAVSARHSSADGRDSEAESVSSFRPVHPMTQLPLDGPITLQSLHGKPRKAPAEAARPRSARAAWAAVAEARAAAQDVFEAQSEDRGPQTVAVVERGLQREAKGLRSARSSQAPGKQAAAEPNHGSRSLRAAPTPAQTVAATPRPNGGQPRTLRTRSGPPSAPAVTAVERVRRKPAVEEPRPRISAESSRHRVSAEGSQGSRGSRPRISGERSSDTVVSYSKKATPESIAGTVNRLAQRKQASVLTSEQRELQEIERRRLAAAAERNRSHDYWQRTKRAGGGAVTPPASAGPPRAFLQKPAGHPADAAPRAGEPGRGRSAAAGSAQQHRTVRPRSTSGTREPRNPRLSRVSPQISAARPAANVLSPFGTTTPPMHVAPSVHSAHGGSATFAGYLDSDVCTLHDGTDGVRSAAQHASPMARWRATSGAGILPTPGSPGQTPVLWQAQHATTTVCAQDLFGENEVHLESTRAQGIQLSAGTAGRGSDSDEVSASLTPRVPASFAHARAQFLPDRGAGAQSAKRGALFASVDLGALGQRAHHGAAAAGELQWVAAHTGRPEVPKRVNEAPADGRGDSMDSTATALPAPVTTGPVSAGPAQVTSAQGPQSKPAPGSSKSTTHRTRSVTPQSESKAPPSLARRVQSARPPQSERPPPPASLTRARSARAAAAAAPASTGRATAAPSSIAGPSAPRSQQRSPGPRVLQSRHGSGQPPKTEPASASQRRLPATVHGAPPPPGIRPQSATSARSAPSAAAYSAGSRKTPLSRSCEPGASWRSFQTSTSVPSALRRDPAADRKHERKRTHDRLAKPAVEPARPLRNLQPSQAWAARALDGAAVAILNQSARGQQDRQVHIVGGVQQPTLMRTHVPISKPPPTKPVSPTLATAKRSQHAQRQPAAVGGAPPPAAAAAGATTAAPRPRSAAARSTSAGSQTSSASHAVAAARSLQKTAVAAFNASGVPRVARKFAARRSDRGTAPAERSRGVSAGTTVKPAASTRAAAAGPRSAAATLGASGGKGDRSTSRSVSGRGQPGARTAAASQEPRSRTAAAAQEPRSRSCSAAPAPAPAPALAVVPDRAQSPPKPMPTPAPHPTPKPAMPLPNSCSTGPDSGAITTAVDVTLRPPQLPPAPPAGVDAGPAIVLPERLSAASSQARELCSQLSDGSLGPVTGAIRGPADMARGQPPPMTSGGDVAPALLLVPDSCVSEVAAEALETIASLSAPAERSVAAAPADGPPAGDAAVGASEEAESFLQGTSFILNTEVVSAHAEGGGVAGLKARRGGVVDAIVSDSGRIVVKDTHSRTGTVSCHDSGTGALNRAAAAAAGVTWAGPPAAPGSAALLPLAGAGSPDGLNSSPAIVAIAGRSSRRERSARLSAALPSRLSFGPGAATAAAATTAGTERLQGVFARRRQSKMLRRQSSSGGLSAPLDLSQRTKSRRMSIEPLQQLQAAGARDAPIGRAPSPCAALAVAPGLPLLRNTVPEDLVEVNADAENVPQVV